MKTINAQTDGEHNHLGLINKTHLLRNYSYQRKHNDDDKDNDLKLKLLVRSNGGHIFEIHIKMFEHGDSEQPDISPALGTTSQRRQITGQNTVKRSIINIF